MGALGQQIVLWKVAPLWVCLLQYNCIYSTEVLNIFIQNILLKAVSICKYQT